MYETEKQLVYEMDDFREDVKILIGKINDYKLNIQLPMIQPVKFDGVYGIPAGGLVLAIFLHYRMDLPLMLAPTQNTLVVDDIVDAGHSISHYIAKGNFTASLFCKVGGKLKPNIWLREKEIKWIHFPWEKEEDLVTIKDYVSPWEKK